MLTSPLLAYCVLGTDGKEPPLARHALQLVSAAVLELEAAHTVHEALRLADRLLVHVVVDPGEHADEPTQLPDRGARDALGHVRRLVALAALAEDQRRHTNRRED